LGAFASASALAFALPRKGFALSLLAISALASTPCSTLLVGYEPRPYDGNAGGSKGGLGANNRIISKGKGERVGNPGEIPPSSFCAWLYAGKGMLCPRKGGEMITLTKEQIETVEKSYC
jgi:hypothetical protein